MLIKLFLYLLINGICQYLDKVMCEINVLRLHKNNNFNYLFKLTIVASSYKLKTVKPYGLCHLKCTSPVSKSSNERAFSTLRFIKHNLQKNYD